MFAKCLPFLSALCLAAAPNSATAQRLDGGLQHSVDPGDSVQRDRKTGGQAYGDRNRGGPYGFYSYPSRRNVDGRHGNGLNNRPPFSGSAGTSPHYDSAHGSAYYGPNYGAPYYGGGYYDRGVYYRERRD